MIRNPFIFILFFGLVACTNPQFQIEENGIVLSPAGQTKKIKIKVLSDEIIHVLATPEEYFSKRESLILSHNMPEKKVDWSFTDEGELLKLTTAKLTVAVHKKTGAITFYDASGKLLLEENPSGGKFFEAYDLEGEKTWKVRQVFESPKDEAFYGLGQHQNGQMNYKGEDVDLTQFNSVVIVPFLVSTHGYGILWDNTSISKFGDPRPYQSLDGLKLYDKEGVAGGLTAHYALKHNPDQPLISQVEKGIRYEWLENMSEFPEDFPLHDGIITWQGYFESDVSGMHKFLLQSAGYVKIWIDGDLKVDTWREAWNPNTSRFRANFEQGKKHHFKMEWIPDGGESYASLRFLDPLPGNEQEKLSLYSEVADEINYYFVHGENMDEIISGYRKLTGKATMMPKWLFGFWQSRERYHSQKELLDVLHEYRRRKIGLDNIVVDWQFWPEGQWGSHEFDPDRFPDPKGMVEEVHRNQANIMISVWPKFNVGTRHFDEFNQKGWLYTLNVDNQQKDWIGYVSTFYDAFNADARKLYWQQISRELYSKGFDAWWLDATEPDILSNSSIDHRINLMKPNALGHPARYFNAYSLVNAQGVYEGQRAENPDSRVFILTRSAFAGLQSYAAATWSGDVSSTFDEMGRQIPAGLNFAMSGLPYWTSDIGGFFVEDKYDRNGGPKGESLEEWRELFNRWFQFGAFSPIFRAHGQYPHREIFNVAPESHPAYKSMLKYNALRYRLIPYIYSLSGWVYHKDYTMMRALVMDFPHDLQVRNIADQYMLGPSLLINPVYTYKGRSRDLYLPEATGWYDLHSGQFAGSGFKKDYPAPYDEMPVFVKQGSILPIGRDIENTQKVSDPITFFVYAGSDGNFELYEDEETNYNYEKGQFSIIPLRYNDQQKILEIGKRTGSFEGMPENRNFRIVYVREGFPASPMSSNGADIEVEYDGEAFAVKLPATF
jgi:alpha-D-xyloside xylohydrolase